MSSIAYESVSIFRANWFAGGITGGETGGEAPKLTVKDMESEEGPIFVIDIPVSIIVPPL